MTAISHPHPDIRDPGTQSAREPLVLGEAMVDRRRRRKWVAYAIAAGGVLLAALALWALISGSVAIPGLGRSGRAETRALLPRSMAEAAPIYDTAVMPLVPEEAQAINAQRALDVRKIIPAEALRLGAAGESDPGFAMALRCLSQAVYYEAASEPDKGQRAVAQVVLNRARHPAFPNSVCGVVYQGSERTTGCQFSFTCDGSLARRPSVAGWARAERVARAALGGRVEAAVGNATHYHADYVVPYWAPTLDKAATIGRHIFYLMRGYLGSPRAFSARYAFASELAQPLTFDETAEIAGEAAGLAVPPDANEMLAPPLIAPAADARSGRLLIDSASPSARLTRDGALHADDTSGKLSLPPSGGLRVDEVPAQASDTPEKRPEE